MSSNKRNRFNEEWEDNEHERRQNERAKKSRNKKNQYDLRRREDDRTDRRSHRHQPY